MVGVSRVGVAANGTEELPEVVAANEATESEPRKCPRCQCELQLIQATTRPSWREVFERLYSSPDAYSPMWHIGNLQANFPTPSPRPWQERRMSALNPPPFNQLLCEFANKVIPSHLGRPNTPRRSSHAHSRTTAVLNPYHCTLFKLRQPVASIYSAANCLPGTRHHCYNDCRRT